MRRRIGFTVFQARFTQERSAPWLRVWLSDDDRRVPVRIDIEQKYGATLKLDLER